MTYTINPDIIATDLQDELVLLDPRTSLMFTLNEVGKTVWQSLKGGAASLDALVQQVTTAFDVPEHVARQDVRDLLEELNTAGLVRLSAR